MKIRNNIYKAGVLLLAVMMCLSVIPAITADSDDFEAKYGIRGADSTEVNRDYKVKLNIGKLPYNTDGTLGTFTDTWLTYNDGYTDNAYAWTSGNPWQIAIELTDTELSGFRDQMVDEVRFSAGSDGYGFYVCDYDIWISDVQEDPNTVTPVASGTSSGTGWDTIDVPNYDIPDTGSLFIGVTYSNYGAGYPGGVDDSTGGLPERAGWIYNAGWTSLYAMGLTYINGIDCGVGGGTPPPPDCYPDACDFEVVSINNVLDESRMNSLPDYINVTIANNGMIPIGELKILADVYEKICGDSYQWCDDLEKDKYDPRFDSDNENWTTFDDPADDADDEGDTFALQVDEFHSGSQAYRCTLGKYRSSYDEDVYIGRSAAIADDALIWEPANVTQRQLVGKAGAVFSFWHKATGEYTTDEDDNVIPIDYGWLQYSLDDGATWVTIPQSDFVAYDNAWEQWNIKFINTAANGGHYDTVCDAMACNPEDARTICIEEDFDAVGATYLKVRFNWHVNPCNQYEGWYIDDVCFENVDEYYTTLVHQTHEIIELDACTTEYYEFPLAFDPEPDTWYMLCVSGQVFQPVGCEADLENNEMCVQFKVTDIHDIACVGITGPEQLDGSIENHVPYEVTVKNVGTFAESEFPVDLKVAKSMSELLIDDDFETEPGSPWNFYYFTGSDTTNYFQWTEGYENIVGSRSKLPGNEAIICANLGYDFPMLMSNMGSLMTDDEIYDFSDLDCGESAIMEFSVKYAIPAGVGGACLLVHPTEGPDSSYWWIQDFGAWNPASDVYANDWIDFAMDMYDLQDSFSYTVGGETVLPPVEFGFGVITNEGITDFVVDTPLGPWGGLMLDNIKLNHVYQDSNAVVVDTKYVAVDDVLEVGEEATVELWWNDTTYCTWNVIGDANLATDVDPANDLCCIQTSITAIMDAGEEFETEDLTCCLDDSLWHLCTSRPPADDTFYWCGVEGEGFYQPNMDDSLIGTVDLGGASGAQLIFDTYYMIEYGWDFGYVSVRDGDALFDEDPLTDPPAWILLDTLTGYMDWHTLTYNIPQSALSEHTQIRFRFVSDDIVQDEGWYIDDVCIDIAGVNVALDEGFETEIPADWSEIVYSGTGHWEHQTYGGGTSYEPYDGNPGSPPAGNLGFATADSDTHTTDVFDVELFSKSMDLSTAAGIATIDLQHCFEDYAGDGEAYIQMYSGGFGPGYEEGAPLIYMDVDADDGYSGGGAPFSGSFDPTTFADPSDVYVGFWYSTNGGTYAWSYSIDDVLIQVPVPGVQYCDDFEGGSSMFTWDATASCAGQFWEETTELLYGFTEDLDGDGDVWLCHNWPSTGVGLNNALWTEIDLTDATLTKAVLEFGHQWILEPGCEVFIEISTDYNPDDCMGISDAEWIAYYIDGIPDTVADGAYAGLNYPDWQMEQFDLTPYLGQTIYLRFRMTTPGEGMYVSGIGGWMVDGLQISYKEQVFTDDTPPVTTLVFDDLTGTVSLFAYDPTGEVSSGVCTTYYKVDGGSTTEYTGPFTLGEGVHNVEYWSIDCAGNEESHHTSPDLIVDTTAPTVQITAPEDALYLFGSKLIGLSNTICIGKVNIAATASDASGIKLVTFDVDGDTGYDATAPFEYTFKGMMFGAATITVTAYDEAGLTAQDSKDIKVFSLGLI
jgi:hypothetical protein